MSEPGGGPELPVTAVAATSEPGTENGDAPGGLGIVGRGKDIPMGGLWATLAKFAAVLFVGNDVLEDIVGGAPSRAAMICALSWYSRCLDLSNFSFTLTVKLSASLNIDNFASSLRNCLDVKKNPRYYV